MFCRNLKLRLLYSPSRGKVMVKRSPLYELQKKLGARFTEFAGFEMPIQYSSIKDEHLTVRKTVGIFDVSHMSNVWITGEEAEDLISLTTVEDASRIGNKQIISNNL